MTGQRPSADCERRRKNAERQRRKRQLDREGIIVLRVAVPEVEASDILVRLGYLAPTAADDRAAIERAAAELLTNVHLPESVTRDNAASGNMRDSRYQIRRPSR
ncbi:hypothetical protein [Thalassobaculum sp.]|uniref:hypothetical protein n=1 Tax=Thalassobaculum sp. TaxID=2022740 RepID=UPI003B5B48A3